jgi:hypothetical protein
MIVAAAMSAVLVLVSSNGCSSGSGSIPSASCNASAVNATGHDTVDSLFGDVGSTCGWGTGDVTFGMAAAGDACTSPTDCSPVCCPCRNGAYHSIATWCNAGTCASPEETCCMILGSGVCGNGDN